jgi:hypothetical protein
MSDIVLMSTDFFDGKNSQSMSSETFEKSSVINIKEL